MADETQRARVIVHGQVEGFPVEVEALISPASLPALVRRLKEVAGLEPLAQSPQAVVPVAAPSCPDHGTPMKQGKYGWYCPRKEGDTYCSRKA